MSCSVHLCSILFVPPPPPHTHTHTHIHASTHMHSCAHTHTHADTHTHIHIHTHTHTVSLLCLSVNLCGMAILVVLFISLCWCRFDVDCFVCLLFYCNVEVGKVWNRHFLWVFICRRAWTVKSQQNYNWNIFCVHVDKNILFTDKEAIISIQSPLQTTF